MSRHLPLKKLFKSLQAELEASLRSTRGVMLHPVDKGRASEVGWLEMLKVHLPNRYEVESGTVVDANGKLSDSIDIIVFDGQYSPLLFKREGTCYVPAESVYAVFEVKQELNKESVEYAGEKAASVRRLERTSAPIPHAGGKFEAKELHRILGGILTLESGWDPPLGGPLDKTLEGLSEKDQLELGIALSGGAFETGKDQDGRVVVSRSEPDMALVSFFLSLAQALQRIGTVPAMDIGRWAQALHEPGN